MWPLLTAPGSTAADLKANGLSAKDLETCKALDYLEVILLSKVIYCTLDNFASFSFYTINSFF